MAFIFDPSKGETPESIKRKRQMAEALAGQRRAPQNVGEGLMALGDAISYRRLMAQAASGEKAGQAQAQSAFAPIMAALGGGGQPSSAPAPVTPPQDPATNRVNAAFAAQGNNPLRDGIIETAKAIGADPMDLATAISYETAGTFDPAKKGPTTQWGQHRGLIQFGQPQAAKFGVDFSSPETALASQLGADGAVAKYFKASGFQPGMSGLDLYSTINAGAPGKYGASDANNGGAPGDVRDKWERQMAGHRQKAIALMGDQTAPAAQAIEASMGAPQQAQPAQSQQPDPLYPMAGASDQLMQAGGHPQGMFPAAPQQGFPPAPQQQGQGGIGLPQLLQAAQNPWVAQNPLYSGIVNTLLENQLKMSQPLDPLQKAQMEKLLLETEQMRNPRMSPEDQARIQLDRDKFDFERNKAVTVGSDSRLASPDGKVLLDAIPKEPNKPSAVQEYEYAKQQGFPGTFQDWEASKKGGMSLQVDPATGAVTFQQGGNIKPMTEGQSKDAVFSTRAEGALPIVDELGEALTSVPQAMGGAIPGVGNFLKSDNYQKAEQASREFLQAILRKDTGAAITGDEMAQYGSTYLPQPWDGPGVLGQKKQARRRALEAIKAGMPPQAILAQEKALSNSGSQPLQDVAPNVGARPGAEGWTDFGGVKIRRKQ